MLIVCPSCSSRYELDEAKIGPAGRKVRCASCQNAWQVEAPVPPAAPEPATLDSDLSEIAAQDFPSAPSEDETNALLVEELRRAAEIEADVSALAAERNDLAAAPAKPEKPRKDGWAKGWITRWAGAARPPSRPPVAAPAAIALAGVVLLGLALWQRDLVVRTMPQFAALYEKLGLPVNLRGLAFSAVESELVQDAQGRFLVVEGDVTNIARQKTKMPPITVAVKDEAGQVLYTWTAEPPRPVLEPSELVRFRARLAAPPENGRSVQVRFGATPPATLASAR
ncbi:DUF3426 domain-containing protein [Bosea sp. (in: a-proteobacteria)]|uniref:DUF3426 domain-containing protein n=1 Tax=Bosea sp. (in: a-proteobacteria) TaxID=1871050 RepID=UPI002FC7D9AF